MMDLSDARNRIRAKLAYELSSFIGEPVTPLMMEKMATQIERAVAPLLPQFEIDSVVGDENRIEMTITLKQGS
jgi:hypothetical protein